MTHDLMRGDELPDCKRKSKKHVWKNVKKPLGEYIDKCTQCGIRVSYDTSGKTELQKLRPLIEDAELTLQFWRANGKLNFAFTTQDGNLVDNSYTQLDYNLFGKKFAETNLLTKKEKECFSKFCISYLETLIKERVK